MDRGGEGGFAGWGQRLTLLGSAETIYDWHIELDNVLVVLRFNYVFKCLPWPDWLGMEGEEKRDNSPEHPDKDKDVEEEGRSRLQLERQVRRCPPWPWGCRCCRYQQFMAWPLIWDWEELQRPLSPVLSQSEWNHAILLAGLNCVFLCEHYWCQTSRKFFKTLSTESFLNQN